LIVIVIDPDDESASNKLNKQRSFGKWVATPSWRCLLRLAEEFENAPRR
jgi:hypothetical protein